MPACLPLEAVDSLDGNKNKHTTQTNLYKICSLSPLRFTERKGGNPARRQYVITPMLHLRRRF